VSWSLLEVCLSCHLILLFLQYITSGDYRHKVLGFADLSLESTPDLVAGQDRGDPGWVDLLGISTVDDDHFDFWYEVDCEVKLSK
jgi:hypothetical protein